MSSGMGGGLGPIMYGQDDEHELGSAYALLRDAKKMIASPKAWCQGNARMHDPDTGAVLRRDLLTALQDAQVAGNYSASTLTEVLDAVYEETGRFGITSYNDGLHTTHAHIYALVERAERRLR